MRRLLFCTGRLIRKEIKDVAQSGRRTLVEFGVGALVAGHGGVFLVFDVEYS